MKRRQVGIVAATLVLSLALTGGTAWADKNIEVTYETVANDSGVVCVTGTPVISTKDLAIRRLNQKIKWHLDRDSGEDAAGTWEITKVDGGPSPSVDICPDKMVFSRGMAECPVAAKLKYSYKLTWEKTGCSDVEADPEIIFESGGGTGMIVSGLAGVLAAAATFAVGLGLGFARGKKSGHSS